jgi:hypothetical protein
MKYTLNSQEELDMINDDYFKNFPDEKGIKFAGCNYYINRGNVWVEPIGSATSMHNCVDCAEFNSCNLKKDTPVWKYEGENE